MRTPREAILSLICGYPARVRRERWLAVHVAHIDESGKGGPLFTVGGLMAKAEEQWIPFSDRWQLVLDTQPAIQFFHLSDRQGLSERSHWAKVDAFIEIINDVAPLGALQLIHTSAFQEFYQGKMNPTYDSPFQMGYVLALQQLALWRLAPDDVIDWVFDDMDDTQYLEILESYRHFKATCPDADVVRRLGREPIRDNDKNVRPLQAADLFAGLWRRTYQGDAEVRKYFDKIDIAFNPVVWDKNKLAEVWAENLAINPELPTRALYEGPKERSARLSKARASLRSPLK